MLRPITSDLLNWEPIFTVESLTKYINGHGDAMGGAIIGKKKYLDIIRTITGESAHDQACRNAYSSCVAVTLLSVMWRQHNANALQVQSTSRR